MFDLKKYKKELSLKYFCVLGAFVLTLLGFILLRIIEDRKVSYDMSKTQEIGYDDKAYIETYNEPIKFYLYENDNVKREYYYVIKEDNLYIFETDDDAFSDFLKDNIDTKHFKKYDDKIVVSGYAREVSHDLMENLELYFTQNDISLDNINVNTFLINTRLSMSRDKKDIYNFLLRILMLIGIPLYITRKNYKTFRNDTKGIDLDILSKEDNNVSEVLQNLPFLFTNDYLIILENGNLFGRQVINLGVGNYHTIGNTFGIFKYTDIKHMVVEANRVANGGEYYILYIVLNNNKSFTYRSKVGETKELFDKVVNECLEKNPEIKNNPEDKDYAKAFIIKYFKRILYIVYLFSLFLLYCLFLILFVTILFDL